MSERSCLYVGQVFHRRLQPRPHTLRYRVFSMLLDLDEIDALSAALPLFSRNRFNLFSFHDRDFGERCGEPLADYVSRRLLAAGIVSAPARTLLSCYPRVLGYAFNPLAVFYCLDASGRVFAVLHEVHNTFGERHAYALAVEEATHVKAERWIRQRTDKALFVSPFNHMDMRYEFRLNEPGERQVIVIRVIDADGHLLTASYTARRRDLRSRALLGVFVALPMMTLKVFAGIHLEAARLWFKRVPRFRHRTKREPPMPPSSPPPPPTDLPARRS